MGFFSWLNPFSPSTSDTEKRSAGGGVSTGIHYGLGDAKLADLLTLNSGPVRVTEETALSLAIVYRCVDVLSSSFASLPWDLYRFDGTVTLPATGHPVRKLLSRPHTLQTSYIWRKTLLTHALLWGNGYARIIRNGIGRPTELKLYHPNEVLVTTDLYRDEVAYRFIDQAQTFGPNDVIHFKCFTTDGVFGRSIVRNAIDAFVGPMQTRRFINKVLENGGRPAAIIRAKKALTEIAKGNIRAGWQAAFGGAENAGKTAVLDEDMEYQQISMSPVDVQLLEFARLSNEQICALMGVPQHMAGILTNSTNNNIEHQGLEFLSYSLRPHIENFQQEFDYKMLLMGEQGIVGSRFDTDSLQLIDVNAKKEYYQFLRNSGIMSANEVRDKINLNPYVGGDRKFIQGANLPLDEETGLPIYPPSRIQPTATDTKPKNGTPVNGQKISAN